MVQSFEDKFDSPEGKASNTHSSNPCGTLMSEREVNNQVGIETQATYRSGVGKLLHMMQWTRQEIMNAVRELPPFAG
jgi:hypothetical protein